MTTLLLVGSLACFVAAAFAPQQHARLTAIGWALLTASMLFPELVL